MLYYLIYLSAATQLPDEAELTGILSVSRIKNTQAGLTGVLFYGSGQFIQVLEGEKEQVQHTYQRISNDPRHKGITFITGGEINERYFPDWSMGFSSINSAELLRLEGYLNPKDNLSSNKEYDLPVKLLKAFIQKNKIN